MASKPNLQAVSYNSQVFHGIDKSDKVEYEIFNEVLDFLYNTDKETLQIAFKELIKCDKEYLSECALTGKFKKICIVDYTKTKRIYNN